MEEESRTCQISPLSPPASFDNFTEEIENGMDRSKPSSKDNCGPVAALCGGVDEPHVEIPIIKSNPRKRKSKFKRSQGISDPQKQIEPRAKRQRLSKVTEAAPPTSRSVSLEPSGRVTNETRLLRNREADEVCRIPLYDYDKMLQGGEVSKQGHKRLSGLNRIRSSVRQFFKGSFWDPPDSGKRARRPPSQWWKS